MSACVLRPLSYSIERTEKSSSLTPKDKEPGSIVFRVREAEHVVNQLPLVRVVL